MIFRKQQVKFFVGVFFESSSGREPLACCRLEIFCGVNRKLTIYRGNPVYPDHPVRIIRLENLIPVEKEFVHSVYFHSLVIEK